MAAMTHAELVAKAIKAAGGQAAVARACGVSQPSVFSWTQIGLPRTEWTQETEYAAVIEQMTGGQFTRKRLLASR